MNNQNDQIKTKASVTSITSFKAKVPNHHKPLELEKFVKDHDDRLVETHFLPPVKQFDLEALVKKPTQDSTDDIFITREIERLLFNGKYQKAYDLYLSDTIHDGEPPEFQTFLAKMIDC